MTFECLDKSDLSVIKKQVNNLLDERQLGIEVTIILQIPTSNSLNLMARVRESPFLDACGNREHRSLRVEALFFVENDEQQDDEESESEAIWLRVFHEIEKDYSNFIPIPEEYGSHVHYECNWLINPDTFEVSVGEMRDLLRLHYVNVLPDEQMMEFVECCWEVIREFQDCES